MIAYVVLFLFLFLILLLIFLLLLLAPWRCLILILATFGGSSLGDELRSMSVGVVGMLEGDSSKRFALTPWTDSSYSDEGCEGRRKESAMECAWISHEVPHQLFVDWKRERQF
jgi:hypothetical protein